MRKIRLKKSIAYYSRCGIRLPGEAETIAHELRCDYCLALPTRPRYCKHCGKLVGTFQMKGETVIGTYCSECRKVISRKEFKLPSDLELKECGA